MKILAIVSRDLEKPSTHYRIGQYLPRLKAKGVEVEFIRRSTITSATLEKVREADVLFNQKCLFKHSLAEKMIKESRRSVFDFDDAIYMRPGVPRSRLTSLRVKRRLHLWLRKADVITLPNNFLRSYAEKYSASVTVIPMALNLGIWKPKTKSPSTDIVMGWTGAPVNIPNIERIESIVTALLEKYPKLKLAIHSGKKPNLKCPFDYHPYQPGNEHEFVQSLDIGLLPLTYEEYTMGKSPIKAIQYLACGVPVVGNILGATAEILTNDNSISVSTDKEWIEALELLINNPQHIQRLGNAGRSFVEKHHNAELTGEKLYEVFSG